jgi:LPS-assembly lipoprotein
MWWRNSRVALGHASRLSVVFGLAGLCAACFQPLYATKSLTGEKSIGEALAQVQIERVPAPNGTPDSRIANEIQNQLDSELNGGGGMHSPTHKLAVRFTASRSSIITDVTTGRVESEISGLDSTFTLTELATGKVVLNGRTFSRVSSDYPGQQQRFARVRARLDAEDRAAKVLAENIRTRLASFFVAGT